MSSTLCWRPVVIPDSSSLNDELKFILRKKFNTDNYSHTFGRSDIPYLEGLLDAGIKGAKELIEAINEHDEVSVKEEF